MAAAPSTLQEGISEELTCSICLELFTRPKVLPCQHTFCQDCLWDHAEVRTPFQCPTCRQQVRLPPQGVPGLPHSHIIANMCERLQQQTTLSGETSLREQLESGNRCSLHPSEVLKLYCKQCQSPVCVLCLEQAHDGHGTTTIKKAAQEMRCTVEALINEGMGILGGYHSFIRGLGKMEEALNMKKQQTDNSIIQAYNQMVQKLTERKNYLLSQAVKNYKKNLEKIKTERDKVLADASGLSAACDRAEKELEEKGVDLFNQGAIFTAVKVVGKYRKVAPTPVQTQPAVFQPTDTPVPVLGQVVAPPLPSAPIPAAPASSTGATVGTGHHHGRNQRKRVQSHPTAPVTRNVATRDTGPHHGNRRQALDYQFRSVNFGKEGSAAGQFKSPSGVTVSQKGKVFVADDRNSRIQVFSLHGTFAYQFSTVLPGEHEQSMNPTDLAMDGEGNLWVVGRTEFADVAVQYNRQGRALRSIYLQRTLWDRGIAVDTRRNHILITQTNTGDGGNFCAQVLEFTPSGLLVRTVGGRSRQQGKSLKCPQYITVDSGRKGNILVSDRDNHCVYVYNEDGQFLYQFGGLGSGKGQLKNPYGICTDWAGNIIVADWGNNRVEMFDKTGQFLKHITTDMEKPHAIAMATQGQLVVTDCRSHTVTIFSNFY